MECPHCKTVASHPVTDSREWNHKIKRTRKCSKCGQRFATFELNDVQMEELRTYVQEGMKEVTKSLTSTMLVLSKHIQRIHKVMDK